MSYGTQPGPYVPPNAPGAGAPIKNWLVESIIVTICCGCPILGIVAIVFAAQVSGKQNSGDVAGAQDAANKAKMFTLISAGAGALVWILNIVAIVASVAAQ